MPFRVFVINSLRSLLSWLPKKPDSGTMEACCPLHQPPRSNRAADAIAETDALGPRWRLDDIIADRVSPDDDVNAAQVIMGLIKRGGRKRVGDDPRYERAFEGLTPQVELNPEQADIIRETLAPL